MSSSSSPTLSVVIPSYLDVDATRLTVLRLLPQLQPHDELLVVDNGPFEDQAALRSALGQPGALQLLHCPTRGSYAARNLGAAQARGEILAFTDAGCLPTAGWLAAIRRHFAQRDEPRVTGPIRMSYAGGRPSICALVDERMHLHQQRYVGEGWAATANVAVRRVAFEAVGGFDPSLASGGDLEFGQRCSDAGLAIGWDERVAVEHEARATLSALLAKRRRVLAGLHLLQHRRQAAPDRPAPSRQAGPAAIPRRAPPEVGRLEAWAAACLYRAVRLHDRQYRRWLRVSKHFSKA